MNADTLTGIIFMIFLIASIALYLWLFFLGGPCTGPAGDVPSWCFA